MTAKLLALAVSLATLIPARASAAGVTVNVPLAVAIVLLAAAVLAVRPVLRSVARYPSSPHLRPCGGVLNA